MNERKECLFDSLSTHYLRKARLDSLKVELASLEQSRLKDKVWNVWTMQLQSP